MNSEDPNIWTVWKQHCDDEDQAYRLCADIKFLRNTNIIPQTPYKTFFVLYGSQSLLFRTLMRW